MHNRTTLSWMTVSGASWRSKSHYIASLRHLSPVPKNLSEMRMSCFKPFLLLLVQVSGEGQQIYKPEASCRKEYKEVCREEMERVCKTREQEVCLNLEQQQCRQQQSQQCFEVGKVECRLQSEEVCRPGESFDCTQEEVEVGEGGGGGLRGCGCGRRRRRREWGGRGGPWKCSCR